MTKVIWRETLTNNQACGDPDCCGANYDLSTWNSDLPNGEEWNFYGVSDEDEAIQVTAEYFGLDLKGIRMEDHLKCAKAYLEEQGVELEFIEAEVVF